VTARRCGLNEWRSGHSDYCRLTSLRESVEIYGIMIPLTSRSRRSRLGLPREYSRSVGGDELFGNAAPGARGGSGGDGGMEAWRLPRPRVVRGIVVYGQVKQRLCAVVS